MNMTILMALACIIWFAVGLSTGIIFARSKRPQGVIEVSETDDKIRYNLIYFDPIDDLPNKRYVTFLVKPKNPQQ